jgi:hypothetical protein
MLRSVRRSCRSMYNEKFSTGKSTPGCFQSFNTGFTQRVKYMQEYDMWRDQHGALVTKFTPLQSLDGPASGSSLRKD